MNMGTRAFYQRLFQAPRLPVPVKYFYKLQKVWTEKKRKGLRSTGYKFVGEATLDFQTHSCISQIVETLLRPVYGTYWTDDYYMLHE